MTNVFSIESPAEASSQRGITATKLSALLDSILTSRPFARSPRLQRFLRFTLDRALAGDSASLKEYTLALEVFDRPPSYDPRVDSIVRVEARRLRRKLRAYYRGPGRRDPVRIDFPRGGYTPVFDVRQAPEAGGVAVLPFVNLGPDVEQDYLCDSLTQEIINTLSRVAGLQVVSRTSVFQFKGVAVDVREIGRKLGAGTVIEGSVRREGGRLRITAQAVDATTGYHLWAHSLDGPAEDPLRVHAEVAGAIAERFNRRLTFDSRQHTPATGLAMAACLQST